jgi:pimeloyl-ACP methyl ester carboxylesterase
MFEPLARAGRVVAPSIPADIQRTAAVARGLASLLERIGAGRVHVFGHSQGGYLAQVLVRAIPDSIASLALSATCLPSARRARTIERQLRLVGLLPEFLLRAGALAQLRRIASVDLEALSPDERAFWTTYLTDGVRAPGLKTRAVASAALQFDYHRNARFEAGDLAHWPGRTLVLTYGLDPIIEPQEGRALIDHYPGATHRAFPLEGHLGPSLHPDAVVDLLVRLAQGQPLPGGPP